MGLVLGFQKSPDFIKDGICVSNFYFPCLSFGVIFQGRERWEQHRKSLVALLSSISQSKETGKGEWRPRGRCGDFVCVLIVRTVLL